MRRPRSRPLALAVLALLTTAALTACDRSEAGAGRTLRCRMSEDPPTLDPALATDTTSAAILMRVHDGLVDFDPETLEIAPAVAERWETSADGRSYTFHLRPGVTFHDGRPVTAADAAWSLRRVLAPETRSQRAWVLLPVLGAASFHEGRSADVPGIQVVDARTLRLELERPFAPFLGHLAMETCSIMPRGGTPAAARGAAGIVGCGPFRLSEWVHSNYIALEAWDGYWAGRATIDRILFRVIENIATAMEEYRAGGLDMLDEIATGQRGALRAELGDQVRVWPQLAVYYYGFNHEMAPFKGNRALRQAFNHAVDKDYICRVLQEGKDVPQTGILPPGIPGHDPGLRGYPFDPARARELLTAAGYPGGRGLPEIPLWFNTNNNHQRIATQVQSDLARIGVRIVLRNLDFASYLQAVEGEAHGPSQVPFFRMGWHADYPDPDNFLWVLLHSSNWGPAGNSTRYANPEFDRLVDQARALPHLEDRLPLYRQAERLAMEDAAWLFLYFYRDEALVQPHVQGLVLPALGDFLSPLERVRLARR